MPIARPLTIKAPISEAAAAARAPYAVTLSAQIYTTTDTAPDPTATPIRRAFHSTTAVRCGERSIPGAGWACLRR